MLYKAYIFQCQIKINRENKQFQVRVVIMTLRFGQGLFTLFWSEDIPAYLMRVQGWGLVLGGRGAA